LVRGILRTTGFSGSFGVRLSTQGGSHLRHLIKKAVTGEELTSWRKGVPVSGKFSSRLRTISHFTSQDVDRPDFRRPGQRACRP